MMIREIESRIISIVSYGLYNGHIKGLTSQTHAHFIFYTLLSRGLLQGLLTVCFEILGCL